MYKIILEFGYYLTYAKYFYEKYKFNGFTLPEYQNTECIKKKWWSEIFRYGIFAFFNEYTMLEVAGIKLDDNVDKQR